MNSHHTTAAERRAQLQRQSAAQRQALGEHMQTIERQIGAVDEKLLSARRALQFAGKSALLFGTARRMFQLFRIFRRAR